MVVKRPLKEKEEDSMFLNRLPGRKFLLVAAIMTTICISACDTSDVNSGSSAGIVPASADSSAIPTVGVIRKPSVMGMEVVPTYVLVTDINLLKDTVFLLRYDDTSEYVVGIIKAGHKESISYRFPDSGSVTLMPHKDLLDIGFTIRSADGSWEVNDDYIIQKHRYNVLETHRSVTEE